MIAKKLAIQEETQTIKKGCCIPIIQDGETKRISYNTLKTMILSEVEQCISKVESTPFTIEVYENGELVEYTHGMTISKGSGGNSKVVVHCGDKTYLSVEGTNKGIYTGDRYIPFYYATTLDMSFYEIDTEKNILCLPINIKINVVE